MADGSVSREDEMVHRMKNHLTIILGFCELLLEEMPAEDAKRHDLMEIHKAATHALADIPDLARRLV